jgi:predicted transglutaminase-like cysteine proteinase
MIYKTFTTNLFVSTTHCEDSKLQEGKKKTHEQLHLNVKKNKPKSLETCKIKPKQQWKPTKRQTNKLQKINKTFNEIKNI